MVNATLPAALLAGKKTQHPVYRRLVKFKPGGPSGASVMLRGSLDWTWGTEGRFIKV